MSRRGIPGAATVDGGGSGMSLVLRGGRIATGDGVLADGWVEVADDGTIASVGSGTPEVAAGTEDVDLAGSWLVPGFVDIHCHGGGGASYTEVAPDRVEAAALAHRKHGTTTTMASLVSRPIPLLVDQVKALADVAK